MLKIRRLQMDAIRANLLKPRIPFMVYPVISRLQSLGLLPELIPPGYRVSTLAALVGSQPAQDKERLPVAVFRAVKQAVAHNVTSVDGVTQFVSYGIMVSPTWFHREDVREVLLNQDSEYDRLMTVHGLLS